MKSWIDSRLPSPNLMYGVRIRGRFEHVETRSVPPADKPYPPLVDASYPLVQGEAALEHAARPGAPKLLLECG